MVKQSIIALSVLIVGFFSACTLFSPYENIDEVIQTRMAASNIPGLTASIVKNDVVVWSGSYGLADIEKNIPVTDETQFMTASLSKTIVAFGIMQLYEEGKIDLDADINTYLPYSIRNPFYPDEPITTRMLLNHSSTIIDDLEIHYREMVFQTDSPYTLEELIKGYLLPGGKWYSGNKNFQNIKPGTQEIYSNTGITLAAYIIEQITGMNFKDYCETRIFTPLGITKGTWFLEDADKNVTATPYSIELVPLPLEHFAFWPGGSYRTTALDYIKLLSVYANKGVHNGTRFLKEETVAEMLQPRINKYGIVWYSSDSTINGKKLYQHGGHYFGYRAETLFDTETKTGVVILTNSDVLTPYPLHEIIKALFNLAENY